MNLIPFLSLSTKQRCKSKTQILCVGTYIFMGTQKCRDSIMHKYIFHLYPSCILHYLMKFLSVIFTKFSNLPIWFQKFHGSLIFNHFSYLPFELYYLPCNSKQLNAIISNIYAMISIKNRISPNWMIFLDKKNSQKRKIVSFRIWYFIWPDLCNFFVA